MSDTLELNRAILALWLNSWRQYHYTVLHFLIEGITMEYCHVVERQSNHHSDFQFKSRLVSFEMMDNELVGLVNFWVQDLRRKKCSACTDNL